MALRNSVTGEIRRPYSIEELKDAANLMRGYDLVALNAAGSGHAGGTLSSAPWELIKEFGVSAEHIARKVVELVEIKKKHLAGREDSRLLTTNR